MHINPQSSVHSNHSYNVLATKHRNISNCEKNCQENKSQKIRFQFSTPVYYHDIPKDVHSRKFEKGANKSRKKKIETSRQKDATRTMLSDFLQTQVQKLNCRSMEACWPNLWANTAVKRRTWDFPYPAMRKLVHALAAARERERERGCTTVRQDLGFRIRRTTTTRQKTKIRRGKVSELIDERD